MEDVFCVLCGEKIKKKKGQREDVFKAELQASRHQVCEKARRSIVKEYNVGQGQHLGAIIEALFEKFPDLKETEAYRAYDQRAKAADAELLKTFPHLAMLKADEEEKKKRAQEANKKKDEPVAKEEEEKKEGKRRGE